MSKNSYSRVGGENVRLLQALIDEAPSYTKPTNSRNANILKSIINNTEYNEPPQSEIEELLIALKAKIGGEIEVNELTVTGNGSYDAGLNKAYNPVNVELPLDSKEITANGTYNASEDNLAGFSQVTVNVEGYKLKDIPNTPTAIATFSDGSDLPMPKLEVGIEPVQEGSGDPSPTNIRPIIGWGEVNVGVSGVNVWDEEWENGYRNSATGAIVFNTNNVTNKNLIKCLPNTSYYWFVGKSGYNYLIFYDAEQNRIDSLWTSYNSAFTTPSNCYYLAFTADNTTYNHDICINYPSTDTSYHAYNGHTYNIDLDGTRYGGTLDIISGLMTLDRAYVDLGTLTWESSDVAFYTLDLSTDIFKPGDFNLAKVMCSIYRYVTYRDFVYSTDDAICCVGSPSGRLYIKDSRFIDATAFKTAMNGVQLVYELATPLTIQLTPTVVKSLEGVNNISADSGDVLGGKYFAKL
jgi:hypothetical protein